MLATVIFDLTVAILLGVAYSAILYIAKSSQIGVSFSDIDANKLRTVEGAAGAGDDRRCVRDRLAVLRRGG